MLEEDVPFGAQEEKPNLKKSTMVGIAVLVVMLVAALAVTKLLPTGAQDFSIDKVEVAEEEQVQVAYVYVHVIGCVKSPGVVGVAKDARLVDVIEAAGGFTEDANVDALNLARTVTDGEQVRVTSVNDVSTSTETASSATSTSGIDSEGRVNINTATLEELCTVSGIGESTAQKIIDEREANGPFASVDDLTRVSGIGDKKLANFRSKLTV